MPRGDNPLQTTDYFQYRPLDDPNQIRLLTVLPESFHEDLYCTLWHGDLAGTNNVSHSYDALSYVWGDPTLPKRLVKLSYWEHGVSDMPSTTEQFTDMPITPSLHNALRCFRHSTDYLIFWIDALCINQNDVLEKEKEILKMGKIYSLAFKVRVWLGLPDEISATLINDNFSHEEALSSAFDWFDRYAAAQYPRDISSAELNLQPSLPELYGICNVYSSRWFTRVWVLQEVVLAAGSIRVHIGRKKTTLWTLLRASWPVTTLLYTTLRFDLMARSFQGEHFDTTYRLLREKDFSSKSIPEKIMAALFSTGRRFSTSIAPHDRLYGMFGMIGNTEGISALVPNYEKPRELFLEDLARYLIESTGTGVILDAWEHDRVEYPSWVPTWEHLGLMPHLSVTRAKQATKLHFSENGKCLHINASGFGSLLYLKQVDHSVFSDRDASRRLFGEMEAAVEAINISTTTGPALTSDVVAEAIVNSAPLVERSDFIERYKIYVGRSTWPGSLQHPQENESGDERRLFDLLKGLDEVFNGWVFFVTTKKYAGICRGNMEEKDSVYWIPGCGGALAFRRDRAGLKIVGRCNMQGFHTGLANEDQIYEMLENGTWEDIVIC